MDAGLIGQGMRAQVMQQAAAAGINVNQMMESGASFMDIMMMIIANTQTGQAVDGIMGANNADTLFIPNEPDPAETEGLDPEALRGLFGDNFDEKTFGAFFGMQDNEELSDILDIEDEMTVIDEMPEEVSGVQESEAGHKTEEVTDVKPEENVSDKEDPADDGDVQKAEEEAKLPETEKPEVPKKKLDIYDIKPKRPAKEEAKTPAEKIKTDVKVKPQKPEATVKNKADKNDKAEKADAEKTVSAPRHTGGGRIQPAVNVLNYGNASDIGAVLDMQNNGNAQGVQNIQQIVNPKLINGLAELEKLYMEIPDGSKTDAGSIFRESGISQQLENLFSAVSPDVMKNASEIRNDGLTNGQKFMLDLMASTDKKDDIRDSFDFSDDIIKADPMQLAGLLDFISTGVGIPAAADLSDSEIFKNNSISPVVSEKIVFDPEEMIKSGEMEIVSYKPAAKEENTEHHDSERKQSHDEHIGFARTMKSVRENVKPLRRDEDDDDDLSIRPDNADKGAVTMEELSRTSSRRDISFERAYAELEMNKNRYGSADEQLAKGVAENLRRGRSEFTVKLKPEGLGEILVKLVSDEGGKSVLSMVASSVKTAELLNRDLPSLQASLNNHNVEIADNSVKTAETVNHTESAFSQFDQRRQDEGQQQNHYRDIREQLRIDDDDEGYYGADDYTMGVQPAAPADDSALNIMI